MTDTNTTPRKGSKHVTVERRERRDGRDEQTNGTVSLLIDAETFGLVVKALHTMTEELPRLTRDNSELKTMVLQLAQNQQALGEDIRRIAEAVTPDNVTPIHLTHMSLKNALDGLNEEDRPSILKTA